MNKEGWNPGLALKWPGWVQGGLIKIRLRCVEIGQAWWHLLWTWGSRVWCGGYGDDEDGTACFSLALTHTMFTTTPRGRHHSSPFSPWNGSPGYRRHPLGPPSSPQHPTPLAAALGSQSLSLSPPPPPCPRHVPIHCAFTSKCILGLSPRNSGGSEGGRGFQSPWLPPLSLQHPDHAG